MEGYGYAILFSIFIFFLDSLLAFYCVCRLLQLLGMRFLKQPGARWSLIIVSSIPATYFLSREIGFVDRFYFISLLILFIISVILKLSVYNLEQKKL
jgi:hypothetical protein